MIEEEDIGKSDLKLEKKLKKLSGKRNNFKYMFLVVL